MQAYSLIRPQPFYRADAFRNGLRAAGHQVHDGPPSKFDRDTLLLCWNRYGWQHEVALKVEASGGIVLVAENGYIGHGGKVPKFSVHPLGPKADDFYSLAIGWHNGRGSWKYLGPERFEALGVELKPWRTDGDRILICPNRSFGVGNQVMPSDWAEKAAARLRKQTTRPVVVRTHPGNDAPKRPLSADLEGAWAVVIWSSGAGVHALVQGIPVVCEAPYWICKSAAFERFEGIDTLAGNEFQHSEYRRFAMERLAWAQWELREIEQGLPFRYLLPRANGL